MLVAVDVALLTLDGDRLSVLLRKGTDPQVKGRWMLPGAVVHEGEQLRDAALRALAAVGVQGQAPSVLGVLDGPEQAERDARGPVLCVAHGELVPTPETLDADLVLAPVDERWPGRFRTLPRDQDRVVRLAVAQTRAAYAASPDPAGLLGPEAFTLTELRHVHEAVLGEGLQRDTFGRKMQPLLVETGEQTAGTVGRPSHLYFQAT